MDYGDLYWTGKEVGLEVKPRSGNKFGENDKIKGLEISVK